MISKIKKLFDNKRKELIFFLLEFIYLIYIDVFNKYLVSRSFFINDYLKGTSVLFSLILIFMILIILYILGNKIKTKIALLINFFLLLFSITNYFMYSYFTNIFSWKDIFLSGEGFAFINSIFKYINFKLILFLVVSLFLIVLISKIKINTSNKKNYRKIIVVVIMILILLFSHSSLRKKLSNIVDGWNSNAALDSDSNYFVNWLEPVRLMKICGTYEYIIRDFYISFIKKDNISAAKNKVESFINNYKIDNQKEENNNYNGIFKNKNLIFVMMESLDNWLVNEEVTPTIFYMMQHGFNFNNHYSPGYVTGDTANTEFIANTGIYPYINKLSPNYAYVNNDYPFSIANLFKNNGYTVNSFHRSNGFIYNRSSMHMSLGYEKYHNYLEMGISEAKLDLDSYITMNAYDKIVSSNKFMSFIITYSPHSPYTYSKIECETNLNEIKKIYPNEQNEEYLCAYSAARETDNMFKTLLEKLKQDNLLDDTIIIGFSDHPNHIKLIDNETDLLNKTVFFIYSNDMSSNQIQNITSSINILPTVKNLFGFNTDYIYPGYDALNTTNGYVIFKNYTYYDGKEIKVLTNKMLNEIDYSSGILISNYYAK